MTGKTDQITTIFPSAGSCIYRDFWDESPTNRDSWKLASIWNLSLQDFITCINSNRICVLNRLGLFTLNWREKLCKAEELCYNCIHTLSWYQAGHSLSVVPASPSVLHNLCFVRVFNLSQPFLKPQLMAGLFVELRAKWSAQDHSSLL